MHFVNSGAMYIFVLYDNFLEKSKTIPLYKKLQLLHDVIVMTG
jgi:hypothetical protein